MMELDLGLGVLDHQLVDSEGRRCGKVDDLELEGVQENDPRVAAIVVGPAGRRCSGSRRCPSRSRAKTRS